LGGRWLLWIKIIPAVFVKINLSINGNNNNHTSEFLFRNLTLSLEKDLTLTLTLTQHFGHTFPDAAAQRNMLYVLYLSTTRSGLGFDYIFLGQLLWCVFFGLHAPFSSLSLSLSFSQINRIKISQKLFTLVNMFHFPPQVYQPSGHLVPACCGNLQSHCHSKIVAEKHEAPTEAVIPHSFSLYTKPRSLRLSAATLPLCPLPHLIVSRPPLHRSGRAQSVGCARRQCSLAPAHPLPSRL